MFNSPLDAYGSVNRPAGPHNIAASHVALVNPSTHKAVDKGEISKQPKLIKMHLQER